jgi:H/ACA ribonucleoprotein complex subunit 2
MSDTEMKSPKSAKKSKKSDRTSSASTIAAGKTYEERVEAVNVIAKPLACKKSTKKAHKLVKKAATAKRIRRGVKEVVKGLRKGEGGLCVLAGDIYPLDVYSFLPCLLEEKNVPYIFVPSKQDLGAAACTKRPTSVVLVKDKSADKKAGDKEFDGQELMDTLLKEAKEYNPVESN